jgi:hypothetical protein
MSRLTRVSGKDANVANATATGSATKLNMGSFLTIL